MLLETRFCDVAKVTILTLLFYHYYAVVDYQSHLSV